VLADIYARETSAHVAAVRAYLEREASAAPPHALPEEVYRAVHTLSGSSNMAEARHGIRLAQPLDQWLRKAFDSGTRPRRAAISSCSLTAWPRWNRWRRISMSRPAFSRRTRAC
jgi:chemotaxis protein histidine kinase CheA